MCGGGPALDVTFRGHRGFVVLMQFVTRPGPYCRDCGLATFRATTADSLCRGWWSVLSLVVNPVTILSNLPARRRVAALPEPLPGAPIPPLDGGRPVLLRPSVLGVLLLILVPALVVVVLALTDPRSQPEHARAGDCVYDRNARPELVDDPHPDVKVVSCTDTRARSRVVARVTGTIDARAACAAHPDADGYFVAREDDTSYTLCLRTLN
ncbi:MAG: hypothetical protein HOQ24_17975 [Mycobacteriaceae bacterium]|nr:hypothetical protein [Mycobacteriaceae bacterium]